MLDSTTILGFVAGGLTSLCVVPQVCRIWKTKSAKDVSYKMYFVLTLGVAIWIVYGILREEIAIVVTNSVSMSLNLCVIFLKFRYENNAEQNEVA